MKIRPVGAVLFHKDRRMGRHDEANSRFSQFCDLTYKFYVLPAQRIYVFCMDLRTNSGHFAIQLFITETQYV